MFDWKDRTPLENEITQYIAELNRIYKAGNAIERSYHPALKSLLEKMITDKEAYLAKGIQTISQLSKTMAVKAKLIANIIENTLDCMNVARSAHTISRQLKDFRKVLTHNISHKEFADMYAQTIAYGMFVAKLNNTSPNPSKGGELTPTPLEGAGEEVNIDISHLANGLYFLKVDGKVFKVIKQ